MTPSADRPRVLLLRHAPGAGGGIATFADLLAGQLTPNLDTVTVPYRRIYPPLTAPGRAERLRVPHPPAGVVAYLPWTWAKAVLQVVRVRPRLVVAQWWHPLLAPFLLTLSKAAHLCGGRVAIVCHNVTPHERFPLAKLLTRATLRSVDIVWTLSDYVAEEVRQKAPATVVASLTHPPNLPSHDVPARVSVPLQSAAGPTLLFFGHVRPYKGLDDLLAALALTTSTPAPTLRVVGPFYEPIERVRRRVDELGLRNRVQLINRYVPDDELATTFASADLVVLPYRSASQSGVLSLAAHFGKPVVATDVGSLRADLAGTGRLVPAGDPQALATALDEAIASPPPPPPTPRGWEPWVQAVTEVASMPPATRARRQWLARSLVILVVVCTGLVFARAITASHGRTWPGAVAVSAAAAALVAARLTHISQWHLIVRGYNGVIGARASARILTSAELARFIPGAFWHFAAGYRLSTKAGLDSRVVVATMCTDVALRLAGAFAVFLVTIAGWPHASGPGVLAAVVGLIGAVTLLHPKSLRFLVGRLTRHQGEAGPPARLPTATVLPTAALGFAGAALRGGAAAALMAGSGQGVHRGVIVAVIGAVALSWALGVLVPFAPAGLGIQEASGAALIATVAPAASAATTMVVLRVLTLAVEVLTAGVARLVDRSPAYPGPPPPPVVAAPSGTGAVMPEVSKAGV